ncbi:hypothetical protein JCM15457_626 [Liquorilactobacillus sucicola DSM 21376 = JCM 15457]|uniref:Uncharacterized protein n=1 Tax=Liquorilactobacillus sucicola DSM 21376 = JCM 15457 TaxID=1423806 RepID=A0A023CV38_9LACO|nr:hypothetical protein FD15_GL002226 [Liquorilactobacillus sucicola DSM 21376 = JCM 15457]GAJ25748.1 hypothetical protein JCM15457_626 [Liquorilactobacillus sucicola DSM 21376 = JCM 15457]
MKTAIKGKKRDPFANKTKQVSLLFETFYNLVKTLEKFLKHLVLHTIDIIV